MFWCVERRSRGAGVAAVARQTAAVVGDLFYLGAINQKVELGCNEAGCGGEPP
jgi:hypothetical protein